jgi:hypothetical protein
MPITSAATAKPNGKSFTNPATLWKMSATVEDSANLPDPDVIAAEIAEDLQAALDQFAQIAGDLKR